jgi:predicted amidohydrolase YtcJ
LRAFGQTFRRVLPDEALGRVYPLRSLLKAGITMAFSSDAPVVGEASPLLGMQCAQLRQDAQGQILVPDDRVTAEEALQAYSLAGAEVSGSGLHCGRLAPGSWADMVALSGNPLTLPAEELGQLCVRAVMVGAKVRYEG